LLDDLIGYVYTLAREDKRSLLRDAREFSTMLNACGRIGRAGAGIALCMGDRNTALSTGEEIMSTYKMTCATIFPPSLVKNGGLPTTVRQPLSMVTAFWRKAC
jgi:single-stranded DNA-specific DHH superfamily exonuclease